MTTVAELPPETTWNFGNIVQHVAATLDGAASEGVAPFVSVAQLLDGYRHIPKADFGRLRMVVPELKGGTDRAVLEWMAVAAVAELNEWIDTQDDQYRLRDGVRLADLRWKGATISAPNLSDPHKHLHNLFDRNSQSAKFVDDVRTSRSISLDNGKAWNELYESMEALGWIDDPSFDALEDEHGVILVGHRRIRVAAALGIDPRACGREGCTACSSRGGHIRPVACGRGDGGDIARLQFAVASNIGRRDMTEQDRKEIIAVLVGDNHKWSQMSLAKLLGVSQQQISKDLAALRKSGPLQLSSNGPPPADTRAKRSKTAKKDDPALHNRIEAMWDGNGEPPTYPEIIEAAHDLGIVIAKDTALKARDIVEARRDQPAAPTPTPTPSQCCDNPACPCPCHH